MVWPRTALFALLVPGTVLGLVPYRLAAGGWGAGAAPGAPRLLGLLLVVPGAALMAVCFVGFARRGRGTPAPVDPPRTLVVRGPYRWVRNPMYVGGLLILTGEAVLWEAPRLLAYAGGFWLLTHLFVAGYEEPNLARRFPSEFREYRRTVPRWVPHPPDRLP